MTPEQIADMESVWERVAAEYPEFTREHDPSNNYHAVREIVLGGSVTWAAANGYFRPWPGKKVMDIGANAGIYSTFCGLHGADVTAYEPFPEIFSMFSAMLEKTGLNERVKAINAAVWSYTGETSYIGHRTPNEDVTCYNGGVPTCGVVWTPDDYLKATPTKCISFDDALGDTIWDMVKVDIEGAECEIFLSASCALLERIKFSYVEFHPWVSQELYDETIKKMKALFRFKGFPEYGPPGRYEAAYLFRK